MMVSDIKRKLIPKVARVRVKGGMLLDVGYNSEQGSLMLVRVFRSIERVCLEG